MIFRPELIKQIRKGKKTMTRRPVKRGKLGEVKQHYAAGRSYAVQPGRGEPQTCRITVLEARRERLGDITHEDARAEGFLTTQAFFDYWRGLYGDVDHDQDVWVLRFRLGDPERPLFLAGQTQQSDYTFEKSKAPKGEPEVTDDETTARFVVESRARALSERRAERLKTQARTLQKRLREATVRAEREGVDITENLARLHEELENIERKRREEAA